MSPDEQNLDSFDKKCTCLYIGHQACNRPPGAMMNLCEEKEKSMNDVRKRAEDASGEYR